MRAAKVTLGVGLFLAAFYTAIKVDRLVGGLAGETPLIRAQAIPALPQPDTAGLLATRLDDLAGRPLSISHWRGKVLVVNFWATWCPPCRQEVPVFVRATRQLARNGVQVVGIAMDDSRQVRQFARHMQINYPVLLGGPRAFSLAARMGDYGGAVPFTAILSPSGRIV